MFFPLLLLEFEGKPAGLQGGVDGGELRVAGLARLPVAQGLLDRATAIHDLGRRLAAMVNGTPYPVEAPL